MLSSLSLRRMVLVLVPLAAALAACVIDAKRNGDDLIQPGNDAGTDARPRPDAGSGPHDCPPTVADDEGHEYRTLKLGDACWTAENMNVGVFEPVARPDGGGYGIDIAKNDGVVQKICLYNDPANCDRFGALYLYDEATRFDPSEGPQGICPGGWHVATDGDFGAVESMLGCTEWRNRTMYFPDGGRNAPEDYGCEGVGYEGSRLGGLIEQLGGHLATGSGFLGGGLSAYFWSSTQPDQPRIGHLRRATGVGSRGISREPYVDNAYSVRCVQN